MSAKRDEILIGLAETGKLVAEILGEVIPEHDREDSAAELLALLNRMEADGTRHEQKMVVIGAMRGLGFEPANPTD